MGDWSYLSGLLDKVQSHSTIIGKIWMSVLFLFRILVLGAAADKVWGDEHSDFFCNNEEPGCSHACYNWLFPISYVRYWVLQIIFVSTPTLFYLGHAVHIVHREKRMRAQLQNQTRGTLHLKTPKYTDDRGKVKIKGVLLCSYITQLVFKILLEVTFSVGQFYLYGSISMVSVFHCTQSPPCARSSGAECFTSRPTEKTIFIVFMLVVSGVSVLLNIIELLYLLCARTKAAKKEVLAQQHVVSLQQHLSSPAWASGMTPIQQHPSYPAWATSMTPAQQHPSNPAWATRMTPVQQHPSTGMTSRHGRTGSDDSFIDLVSKEKHT